MLDLLGLLNGPSITSFSPLAGHPGTMVTINGRNFSTILEENHVELGGKAALVVSASEQSLRVVTAADVLSGPVKVTVDSGSATGPTDFTVLGYPSAGAGDDGPPISFGGEGSGSPGGIDPNGTIRVLVALVRPSDRTPGPNERADVVAAWDKVRTFYAQASYGRTDVQIDVLRDWHRLDGTEDDFTHEQNIDWDHMGRLTAYCAKAATDEGFDLNDYSMMACVVSLDGFIRGLGGWSQQNFSYFRIEPPPSPFPPPPPPFPPPPPPFPPPPPPVITFIDITTQRPIGLIAISQSANWGRCAHEFGHNIVSSPGFTGDGTATLGEDIYSSDLVDPGAAAAQLFDLMGAHDTHPLFSGYHMEKLGYYSSDNILQLDWSRDPSVTEIDIAAHGLAEDSSADRVHLVKIKIADGLFYYVQVRQQPGTTEQIFDDEIPVGDAANMGGVIVTRVIADTLHTNQQTRFITLLHGEAVMQVDEAAEDPARALRITVVDGAVEARPLVCRVRIEWGQTLADDPSGSFDLKIEPWDSNWQTPDLWVDRAPFGEFDQPLDGDGRPTGNGDRPRPGEINKISGRIHVSGVSGATAVKVTFYAVHPPGVGDNGNWAPLGVQTIPDMIANSFADVSQNWVPAVGQHTCLKLYASQQPGEVSGGNNFAQENVFDFEAAAGSPARPVVIPTAIRNPLEIRRCVRLTVKGVPYGWRVHFPHSWVWLEGLEEKHFDLTVVPMLDWSDYGTGISRRNDPRREAKDRPKAEATAPINIEGMLERSYDTPLPPAGEPAGSRTYSIGGILGRVHVRKRVDIRLEDAKGRPDGDAELDLETSVVVRGGIQPAFDRQRIRVVCVDPAQRRRVVEAFTDAAGNFSAAFDLRFEPSLDADRGLWERASEIMGGTYRVRAYVFAATAAAEAESNELIVTRA